MFVLVLPFAAAQTSAPCPVLVGSGPGPLVFFPVTSSAASVIVLLVLVVGVTPPVVVVSTVLALAILVLK